MHNLTRIDIWKDHKSLEEGFGYDMISDEALEKNKPNYNWNQWLFSFYPISKGFSEIFVKYIFESTIKPLIQVAP